MKIKLVTYETTSYYKTLTLRVWAKRAINEELIPIRRIEDSELDNAEFLCLTTDGRTFVSPILSTPQLGLYVDDVKGKICVRVVDLKEIYIIETGL